MTVGGGWWVVGGNGIRQSHRHRLLLFFLLFATHYPLLTTHRLYAASTEKSFKQDMAYYFRTAKSKNLSANDRVYILEKFRQKYKKADFDLSPLFSEIDKWYGVRLKEEKSPDHKEESRLTENRKPKTENRKIGQLTKILVTEGRNESRLSMEVPGNAEFKDEIKKDESGRNPPVLLFYLYDTQERLKPASRNFAVKRGPIRQVQAQTISRKPHTVKVSIALREDRPYQVARAGNQILLTFPKAENQNLSSAPTLLSSTETSESPPPELMGEIGSSTKAVHVSSFSITVVGAVKSPGVLKLKPGTKLLEAILLAGGFEANARTSRVRVVRRDQGKKLTQDYDLTEILKSDPSRDIALKEGDLIVVPEKNTFKDKILGGKVVPWATFFISMGLVMALLI